MRRREGELQLALQSPPVIYLFLGPSRSSYPFSALTSPRGLAGPPPPPRTPTDLAPDPDKQSPSRPRCQRPPSTVVRPSSLHWPLSVSPRLARPRTSPPCVCKEAITRAQGRIPTSLLILSNRNRPHVACSIYALCRPLLSSCPLLVLSHVFLLLSRLQSPPPRPHHLSSPLIL